MKLPELAGEAGLREMLGNFTGLPAACKCKVEPVRTGPSVLPTHSTAVHACCAHQGPSPTGKSLLPPANNPLTQAGPQHVTEDQQWVQAYSNHPLLINGLLATQTCASLQGLPSSVSQGMLESLRRNKGFSGLNGYPRRQASILISRTRECCQVSPP